MSELPETCGRYLSDFELVGSAVSFSGASKAIDKTGMVLSLSDFFLLLFLIFFSSYSLLSNTVPCNFPRETSLLFCMQVTPES